MALPVVPSWALVRRELLSTLRGTRALAALIVFASAVSLYAVAQWPGGLGAGRNSLQEFGFASRNLVQGVCLGLMAGCLFFVPAYAATAIVAERERATFDFLKLTLIRPSGVLAAKLLNALGLFLLLLVGLAPVLSVTFFLVGVDPFEIAQALTIIVGTSGVCASIGLYASARFRKSMSAIAAAYIGLVLYLFGPIVLTYLTIAALYFFTSFDVNAMGAPIEYIATITVPLLALYRLFDNSRFTGWGASATGISWSTTTLLLAYQLVSTLICLYLTLRILRRPPKPLTVANTKPIDDSAELQRRRTRFPFYLVDPLRRKKTIEDGRNPMLVRELRWGLMNRGTIFIRVFYCAFVVYFFLGVISSIDARAYETMSTWFMTQIVVTIMITPALVANSLTKESELGNMDMLRMTLLRPKDIILGKLFAACLAAVPLLAAALLSLVPVVGLGARNWPMLGVGYATLFVSTYLALGIALFSSLLARRTATALAFSYAIGIIVFVGFDIGILFAIDYLLFESTLIQGYVLSPVIAYLSSVEGISDPRQGFFYFFWVSSMLIASTAATVFILLSIAGFARYRMQDR